MLDGWGLEIDHADRHARYKRCDDVEIWAERCRPHAWIAARRGFTPIMFMTRVRL